MKNNSSLCQIFLLLMTVTHHLSSSHRVLEAPRTVQEIVKLQHEPDTAITKLQLKKGFVKFNDVYIPVSGIYEFITPQNLVTALQIVNLLLLSGGNCALVNGTLECEYSSTSPVIKPLILTSKGIKIYQCPDPKELNKQVVTAKKTAMVYVRAVPHCDGTFASPCAHYQIALYADRSDMVPDKSDPQYVNLRNTWDAAGVDIDTTSKNRVPLRYKVINPDLYTYQVAGKFGDKMMLSAPVDNDMVMQGGQEVVKPGSASVLNTSTNSQQAQILPCRMMNIDVTKDEVMCCYGGPCETTGLKVVGKLPSAIEKCKIYGYGRSGVALKDVMNANKYLSFDFYQYAKTVTMPDGTVRSIPAQDRFPIIIVCED